MRQIQRLALEGLFSWLERQLKHKGHQLPNTLVDTAIYVISGEFGFREGITVGEVLETAGPPIGDFTIFEEKVVTEPERFSPWNLSRKLREAVVEGSELSLTTGLYSLLLLHQCRPFLEDDGLLARHLERGGAGRGRFAHWFRLIDRFRDSPWNVPMD